MVVAAQPFPLDVPRDDGGKADQEALTGPGEGSADVEEYRVRDLQGRHLDHGPGVEI
jgi:hypothetical protein